MRPGPLLAPHPERPFLVISHTHLAPGPWLGGAKGSEALRGWIWTAFRLIPEARNHVWKTKKTSLDPWINSLKAPTCSLGPQTNPGPSIP